MCTVWFVWVANFCAKQRSSGVIEDEMAMLVAVHCHSHTAFLSAKQYEVKLDDLPQ